MTHDGYAAFQQDCAQRDDDAYCKIAEGQIVRHQSDVEDNFLKRQQKIPSPEAGHAVGGRGGKLDEDRISHHQKMSVCTKDFFSARSRSSSVES